MKANDSNDGNDADSPELTPEQLRSIYDRLKGEMDPKETQEDYGALLEHPEQWLAFEDLVKELQAE